ncbi:threonine efflux protein [Dictyobacter alpinus]|uniref:Threonine efflux protein n=1 Tax=Dictyobacter alpinus TaxID=2014873 RepID=A0A402BBD5_9CHLR|nr:LysE family transporter [Dictyobacter alpinus]GCE28738.1 threonine efflux protein [Dictyobacter alpinus]
MSYVPSLIALAGVWLLAVMSPGPDFAAIVQYATTRSRRDGMLVALGVTSAISIWIVGSIVGLGALLVRMSWLVEIIRTIGACYLVYLGIKTILHAHRPASVSSSQQLAPAPGFSAWRVGFITNISNPKAVAFFSSLFIVILPANPPLWVLITSAILMLVIAISWFCIVACIFSLGAISRAYLRAKRWLDYITGGIFIALGIRLAIEK